MTAPQYPPSPTHVLWQESWRELYIYLSLLSPATSTPALVTNRSTPPPPPEIFLELSQQPSQLLQKYNSIEAVLSERWRLMVFIVLGVKFYYYCQPLPSSAHPVVFSLREVQAELYQGRNDFCRSLILHIASQVWLMARQDVMIPTTAPCCPPSYLRTSHNIQSFQRKLNFAPLVIKQLECFVWKISIWEISGQFVWWKPLQGI